MLFPSLSEYHGGSRGYLRGGFTSDIGGTEDQRFTDNISDYKDIDKDFHLFEWKQIYSIAHFIKKYKKGGNRFSFIGIKNTDVSGETNLFPYNTAVYKFDILFVLMQFLVNFVKMLLKFLIILSALTISINIGGKLEIFGAKIWNFCSYITIRPFAWLGNVFPKLSSQDPTCPAYQAPGGDVEARGFVLPCEDNLYCVNMSDPCPGASVGCNIPIPTDVFDSGDDCCGCLTNATNTCSSTPVADPNKPLDSAGDCKVSALCFGASVYVPDENNCEAMQTIEDWACCVIYNLAENRNVIRRSFFDAWVVGTAYLFQFKYKKRAKNNGQTKEKFCGPGSDHGGGNNYHKNDCCPHINNTNACEKCVIRGPFTSDRNFTNIEGYHKNRHNDTVNGNCQGFPCGNGATDIGEPIYCNSYSSTKIVNIGRMEMCEDTVNDIENCIAAQNCSIELYQQSPAFYTGTFFEDGWDPNFWVQGMGPTSYKDPRDVFLYLLTFTQCNVGKLFAGSGNKCHEKELKDEPGEEFYKLIKEISKIQVEVLITEDSSGNDDFDPTLGVNLVDPYAQPPNDSSGFIHDVRYGQRFNPCVNGNLGYNYSCLPPPAPWAPTNIFLNTLVSDGQNINYSFGSDYNPCKNIPYYYFGIIPGRTAIEKLRKEFFVPV
jgi:hypothetical protein